MSYQRKQNNTPAVSQPVNDFSRIEAIETWLVAQAKTNQMATPCYLLAHATDGVIWGRLDKDGNLLTSHDALCKTKVSDKWDISRVKMAKKTLPPLRMETLQQARLFSSEAELFIWRDGDGEWNGRWLRNANEGETPCWSESFDEPQLLWGTHATPLEHGFTLLEDGAQGLYHAVPLKAAIMNKDNGELKQSVQLNIRHYLAYDEQGQAYVAVSRLVEVKEK